MAVPTMGQGTGSRRLPLVAAPGFVGRDAELAAIGDALSTPPAMVLVEGEAGIGKSRLVSEVLASPPGRQRTGLVAVCPPFRQPQTLAPIVDAVRRSVDEVADLRLSALGGALRPLFPEWADQLPPVLESAEDVTAARHRLFRALAELFERLQVDVVVLEDVHWADEATLELLLFLTSREEHPSLVVTYRPEDVPEGSLLLRMPSRLPAGTRQQRLVLGPLDVTETAGLVSSMLADEKVSDEFATFLYEHADGVPLAVEELVRLLVDRADVALRDGEWVRHRLRAIDVPPTVRDAVLERVARLDEDARAVLLAAAVLTQPTDEATLLEVSGLGPETGRAGLVQALRSGLLAADDRWQVSFRHALAGRAVYEAIPTPERTLLHARAGRAFERWSIPPVARLARHFREAGESTKWAKYAEQAAGRAMAVNDYTAAARLLNDVLAIGELPTSTRARLASKAGRATLFRSEPVDDLNRDVVRTLHALLETGAFDPAEQADIRNPLGRLLMQLGQWDAGYRELEAAATNLSHDPVEAARVMTYLGFPLVGHRPASVHRTWLLRAAEHESSVKTPVDRIMLTGDRATALVLLGDAEGWKLAAGLPTTAPTPEERRELSRTYSNLAWASVVWGRYADSRRRLAVAYDLAEADGYMAHRYEWLTTQAYLDWLSGAWDGLADRLTALLDLDDDQAEGYSDVLTMAGWFSAAQGARDQAENHFRLALDTAGQHELVHESLAPAAQIGRLRLTEGRVDEAVGVTDQPMHELLGKGIWVWATDIVPVRTEALLAVGRAEEAAHLVATFARELRSCNAPAPRAALSLSRAFLAEVKDEPVRASAAYARAASAWDALPRPYDALLAQERQARCLLAADQTEPGIRLLSEVFEGLGDLGARRDADRVAGQLHEHGVRVTRPWRGGRRGYGDQLSPRELDVVRLVVEGQTNRQIADALVVSRQTVTEHVRSAMRKLDVSTRTALAVKVVELSVLADRQGAETPR